MYPATLSIQRLLLPNHATGTPRHHHSVSHMGWIACPLTFLLVESTNPSHLRSSANAQFPNAAVMLEGKEERNPLIPLITTLFPPTQT